MLPSKFGVNWPFSIGEFVLRFYAQSTQLGHVERGVQEKKQKIDFQDGCHGGHLGFPIGTILATFDL